ncbi:MAG: tRNA preQ1(34) S-adenosylmethionine ribosyltransferase-isomerase QueA [Gammaproteobacteria bacterium AqS3]|nr:tRNA preQ1(34) S-adenosylmethionine ribosyltransferase-isomerase QueA [Gammaproteobacteria bacterium AqS3]
MDTACYRYELPQRLIAERPSCERGDSRLLHLGPAGDEHRRFDDLTKLLRAGDLLVLNNTRVMPARLFGRKTTGGSVEILVERVTGEPREAWVQLGASRTPKVGTEIALGDERTEIVARDGRLFLLRSQTPWRALMSEQGTVPLPPYIRRQAGPEDRERYQTVYARTDQERSAAAPTAGLHFTEKLLQHLRTESGVRTAELTLHVGAGTFLPVKTSHPSAHHLHSESVEIDRPLCRAVEDTRSGGGRVIAVGTTCVRALEACSLVHGGALKPWTGETDLFIYPGSGFRFAVVDGLISNFHLPESSLLMLVCAFAGHERVMRAYRTAAASGYRFYSYGDATLMYRAET